MTMPLAPATTTTPRTLPGAVVIARIRRLIYVAVLAGVAYSILARGSKAGCPGGISADGGFLDANGDPSDIAPTCVSLTLSPNPIILIVLVGIVIGALTRVLRWADDDASALRILDRAAAALVLVAAASGVIALVAFGLNPLYGLDGSGTYIWPFPFGAVDLDMTPMAPSSPVIPEG